MTFAVQPNSGNTGGDDGFGNDYNGINKTGTYNPDDKATVGEDVGNDYSYDNAMGTMTCFIICEIDIEVQDPDIYLGWLNPDGVKDISNHEMHFLVTGGKGWPFEASTRVGGGDGLGVNNGGMTGYIASGYNGIDNNYDDLDNVYITGGKWFYGDEMVGKGHLVNKQLKLSGTPGKFNTGDGSTYSPRAWNHGGYVDGQSRYKRSCDNACEGEGDLYFVPGLLWASPDALEGFYTFDVFAEVDYLTFVAKDLTPVGNDYDDPSAYTAQ